MAKTPVLCPFNQKLCQECPLYRGRHYNLCYCEKYRGYMGRYAKEVKPNVDNRPFDFRNFGPLFKRWERRKPGNAMQIRLRVIDMENGTERYCTVDGIKDWDWSNAEILRIVDGYHITSWEKLREVAAYKVARGELEMVIYEGPRFMLLGGG